MKSNQFCCSKISDEINKKIVKKAKMPKNGKNRIKPLKYHLHICVNAQRKNSYLEHFSSFPDLTSQ